VVRRLNGTSALADLGGLYRTHPSLSALYLVSAFSLAGMPPLAGFFAKLGLIQAGLAAGQYLVVAAALFASLLTLLVVSRIWAEAFWKAAPAAPEPSNASAPARPDRTARLAPVTATLLLPVGGLATLTVAVGLAAEPLFGLATAAATQLLDRSAYLRVVLGSAP
jgi:multicomponent Na+:H+ antiporter subunit D